jgi:DNA-binding MarR family transcriptional regulator
MSRTCCTVVLVARREVAFSEDLLARSLDTLVRLGGSRRLHRRQAAAAELDLSQQGFRLLRRVVEYGAVSPGELARLSDVDPAVVTRQLHQLESDGHIERRATPGDRRVSTVRPTIRGRAAVERMRGVLSHHMRLALADWPPGDVEVLAGLLGRLVEDLRAVPYPGLSIPGRDDHD